MKHYRDTTTNGDYPKTLIIRNHAGGMIWQVYHVENENEAIILSDNATSKGFEEITLEDDALGREQTWEDWRDTPGGKKLIKRAEEEIENENN
tara:strand:- start:315 stop:593 length:279 start_codon:yes stop_codon:yes gene_type:complete